MIPETQGFELMGGLYIGFLLGAVYGIFDFLRRIFGVGKTATIVFDTAYVFFSFALTAICMYVLTFGRVEVTHVIVILAGIFLWTGNVHALFKAVGSRQ